MMTMAQDLDRSTRYRDVVLTSCLRSVKPAIWASLTQSAAVWSVPPRGSGWVREANTSL